MGAEWFYEKDRQRLGPIDEETLRALLARGELNGDNLIWNETFGPDWKSVNSTQFAQKTQGPPPLPTTHINNTFAWIIAFIPAAGAILEIAIKQNKSMPTSVVLISYFVVYCILIWLDIKKIKSTGNSTDTTPFQNWFFLVPVYLFKRANALKQPKVYFWTWVGAFIFSTVISGEATSLFDKNTYWGSGLPSCDSNFIKKQTQEIFRDIPLVKMNGIMAIDVKDQKQISGNDKQRQCRATFVTSNGREVIGNYTITLQGDNFYTNLELE